MTKKEDTGRQASRAERVARGQSRGGISRQSVGREASSAGCRLRAGRSGEWQSSLPPLYAGWMADLLKGPIPREADSTCDDCAMWAAPGDTSRPDFFFLPETKCCTYIPNLPNYLVGRILDDTDPAFAAGRATVEARIDARIGVTPFGVATPSVHSFLYERGHDLAFGRSLRLRCPHYLEAAGGRCGIWRHRIGTCATWFCKHVRGAVGNRFWRALEQLLTITERHLARWCLLELRVPPGTLHGLFPPGTDRVFSGSLDAGDLDGVVGAEKYRGLWGSWAGRERELYRRAARLVDGLAWSGVREIGGADVRLFAGLALDRYRDLVASETPGRLSLGPFRILAAGRERTRVFGYSGLHPLDLPSELMVALPYFDGRSMAEALRLIRVEKGLRIQPDLVRKLADFEILVPASPTLGSR